MSIKILQRPSNKKGLALYLGFIFLIALALFLRLYRLDERIFHHDEVTVAYFSFELFRKGIYVYDPAFHGPFIYFAAADMFRLFGDSVFSARLLPALTGTAILILLIPLRRYIGSAGMVISTFFLALSPSFLYYSRFFREDIFIAFFSMLLLVCAVKYTEKYEENKYSRLRTFYLFLGAVSLASLVALKENAYITIALIFLFLVLFLLDGGYHKSLIIKLRSRDKRALTLLIEAIFFSLVFLVVYSLYYTGNFLDFYGMKAAFRQAISHWIEMHSIQRIPGSSYYYLPMLAIYEFPILISGIAGMIYYFKQNNFFMSFLGYWALINLVVYSYIQEKVPWLILIPLLPLIIIAGAYLGELLTRKDFNIRIRAAIIIFLVVSSSYFVYSSILLNYYNYSSRSEYLIMDDQPPQESTAFIGKVNEISSQYQNQSTEIQFINIEPSTRFLWYLRNFDNIKWNVSIDSELNAPLIIAGDDDEHLYDAEIVQTHLSGDYKRLDGAMMQSAGYNSPPFTIDYLLYRKMKHPFIEGSLYSLFYKPKVQ